MSYDEQALAQGACSSFALLAGMELDLSHQSKTVRSTLLPLQEQPRQIPQKRLSCFMTSSQ